MEWAKLVVDLLKSLAWPGALVFLAIYFRDDLRTLFVRVIKAGPTGVEFEAQKQLAKWSGQLKELPGLTRTLVMGNIERTIHDSLQIVSPENQVDLLVRHLAQSRLEALFERIYGAIFGSQIAGLRSLANASGQTTIEDARKFFDSEAKAKYAAQYGEPWPRLPHLSAVQRAGRKQGAVSLNFA